MKEKPELAEVVSPKISDLSEQFGDLEMMTKEKGERLFDANREVLIHQTCDDIDSWMNDLEKQIESADVGNDLASVNILMQKQQVSSRSINGSNNTCSKIFKTLMLNSVSDDRDSNGCQSQASV